MRIDVDGVLFDSDGVLVDSEAAVAMAWQRLADELDLDAATLHTQRTGVRAVDTLARHLHGDDLHTAVTRLEEMEIDLAVGVRTIPGAAELCASLPPRSWTIATSASRELARVRWASAGIPEPERAVTADDVSAGKPDPEPYLLAAERLGVDPSRCVVFEDSPSGGEAARAAGAATVAVGNVPWSFEPAARIEHLAGVRVVDSSTHRFALSFDRTVG